MATLIHIVSGCCHTITVLPSQLGKRLYIWPAKLKYLISGLLRKSESTPVSDQDNDTIDKGYAVTGCKDRVSRLTKDKD